MPKNLSRHGRVLDEWLSQRPGFVFDYDGTLSPLFRHPGNAYMRARTKAALIRLAQHAPCAVLTGRSVDDAKHYLQDVPLRFVVGNHGSQWEDGRGVSHRLSDRLRQRVRDFSATEPGLVVEDKAGFGISMHLRGVPDARLPEIGAFVAGLKGVRIVPGRRIFNIVPKRAPSKGDAVVKLRQALGRSHVLFFGDDVTDEFAFELRKSWLLSIRIGLLRSTAAPYYLEDQRQMDALLLRLAARVIEVDETGGGDGR